MSGNLITMEQAIELYGAVNNAIKNTEELTKELTDGPSENPPADALDIMWKSAGYAADAYMGYKTIKTLFPATMSKVTAAIKTAGGVISTAIKTVGVGTAGLYALSGMVLGGTAYGLYKSATADTEEEKMEKRVQQFGEELKQSVESSLEGKRESEQVMPQVGAVHDLPGYFNELSSYLDEEGNIVSNDQRAQQLFDAIHPYFPDDINQAEDGQITISEDFERALHDFSVQASAELFLESSEENYQEKLLEFQEYMKKRQDILEQIAEKQDQIEALDQKEYDIMAEYNDKYGSEWWKSNLSEKIKTEIITPQKELSGEIEELKKQLDQFPEQLQPYFDEFEKRGNLKQAVDEENVSAMEGGLKKIHPDFNTQGYDPAKIKEDMERLPDLVSEMKLSLDALKEQGANAIVHSDMADSYLRQLDAIRQELLQAGINKDAVNKIFGDVLNKIYQMDPRYGEMYGERAENLFGEQVKSAYDEFTQMAIQTANETILNIQMEINQKMNRPASREDVELQLSEQGLLVENVDEIVEHLDKMQDLADEAGVELSGSIQEDIYFAVQMAEKYAQGEIN